MSFASMVYLFNCSHTSRGICRLNLNEAALLYTSIEEQITKSTVCTIDDVWIDADQTDHFHVLEIGRRHGGSTVLINHALECSKKYHKLISVDIEDQLHDELREFLEDHPHIILPNHDSTTYDSTEIAPQIDYLFVDGDHSYEGVKGDIKAHWNNLVMGGIAAFHDALPNDSNPNGPSYCEGVRKAVDELIDLGVATVHDFSSSLCLLIKQHNI